MWRSRRPILRAASAGLSWCFRDGEELANIPRSPVGRFGRPLFQGMTYHDTPTQPLSEMRYLDVSTKPGETHRYSVIAINSVGLRSEPSSAKK